MQKLSKVNAEVARWHDLRARVDDALELAGMDDAEMEAELLAETDLLEKLVEKVNFEAMLSGTYDDENVILSIHSGAGGTESQDWTAMLMRMFMRCADQQGFSTEIIDQTEGEEAGIKSTTLSIKGPFCYGKLQSEAGVHRLVRISPFDSNKRRHTSFAKVEVVPDVQGEIDIQIDENDLEIDYFRSAGAGGQNVQKNETAVRLVHKPSGLVVTCQNERSQMQNRERALQVLKARLFDLERRKQEEAFAQLRGVDIDTNFGSQIRSYVLHPYQMVKDHRTDYETGNTTAVLDGDLDGFINAYLRSRIGMSA